MYIYIGIWITILYTIFSFFVFHSLTLDKIHSVDNAQEGIAFLRVLGLQKINQTTLKQQRPHILAEELQFELDKEEV